MWEPAVSGMEKAHNCADLSYRRIRRYLVWRLKRLEARDFSRVRIKFLIHCKLLQYLVYPGKWFWPVLPSQQGTTVWWQTETDPGTNGGTGEHDEAGTKKLIFMPISIGFSDKSWYADE